ncbi:hypothetical protein [Rhizocola hellebori]|nr:hypothetical protein [Rhizocola hellebori]
MRTPRSLPGKDELAKAAGNLRWLRASPTAFVSTAPFIALVTELLAVLQNEYATEREAYIAVRRTARLLAAFVQEGELKARQGDPEW